MTYKVVLTNTNEGYSVQCPELPGCWSEGETEQEAISNIRAAIQEYRSVQPKNGTSSTILFVDVPEPSTEEEPFQVPSQCKTFEVKPFPMGLPPGGSYDKIEDLLDLLEGPYRR